MLHILPGPVPSRPRHGKVGGTRELVTDSCESERISMGFQANTSGRCYVPRWWRYREKAGFCSWWLRIVIWGHRRALQLFTFVR